MNAIVAIILIVIVIFGVAYFAKHVDFKFATPGTFQSSMNGAVANISDSYSGASPTGIQSAVDPLKGCVITGCNHERCEETPKETSCGYKTAYACYGIARCERQSSGRCGWTDTQDLKDCISNSEPRL